MKYFIIYKQFKEPKNILNEVYTQDEFMQLPYTSNIEDIKYVKKGRLEIIREFESYRIFNFSCENKIRSKTEQIWENDNFEIWQQKKGRVVTSLDAKKYASRSAIWMISYLTFMDLYEIRKTSLTKTDFIQLYEHVIKEMDGEVTQIFLSEIDNPELGLKLRDIQLKGSHLERIPSFNDYLKYSGKIKNIGLAIPDWVDGRLSFRITHWGGGQIYSPANPSDHQIAKFIELLGRIIIPI